ncbi:hypothetical protein EV401DRAFT_1888783 [Pisolithus croceorrhizus]|nr:hypothetical protein EV401DRAFT_1888783 [Pisolithus croceorrhizus]
MDQVPQIQLVGWYLEVVQRQASIILGACTQFFYHNYHFRYLNCLLAFRCYPKLLPKLFLQLLCCGNWSSCWYPSHKESLAFMVVKGQETCMLPLLTLTKLVEAPMPALLLPPLSTFMSIICVVWFQASTMSHSLLQKLWHKLDDWVKMVHNTMTIIQIYYCNNSKESFAMQLAALGMTLAEATYLGDLIYL